jgi:2-dehydropantoate 2-reductase
LHWISFFTLISLVMKIAIVGCGALGSYYGARLCLVEPEVHFLLRSDFATVRAQGVAVRSGSGDFTARPHAAQTPEAIGVCDLVVIGLKTTANAQFSRLLPPLVGPQTMVVTLQNGLGNEEQLAQLFPATQILGGLCFVCLNRIAPGVIQHMAHGKVILGEFQRPALPRTRELAALLQRAGVACDVTDNLARAHWEKLIWNIPFNGLGVAGVAGYDALVDATGPVCAAGPVLPTNQLLAAPRWETLVRELMGEVITTANALGLGVAPELAEKQIERTRTMGAYKASTLIDFERRQALELDSMFLEPLRQAQAAGVAVPRLAALGRVLRQLDPAGATPP